jgi:hypothetical protein
MIIMAASTFNPSFGAVRGVEQSKPGLFAKFAQQFVAQRTAKARQMTAWYLSSYSDEQLAELGWSAVDIKRLRGAA